MIKVILDTNIVVSGYIWGGLPGKILAKWSSKEFSIVTSPKIVISAVIKQDVVVKILTHLGLPARAPPISASRVPRQEDFWDQSQPQYDEYSQWKVPLSSYTHSMCLSILSTL